MADHWTRYLPEAGTIIEHAERIEAAERVIRRLRHEIAGLRATVRQEEKKAMVSAASAWPAEEIAAAKELAKGAA